MNDDSDRAPGAPPRPLRSFVVRPGRLGPGQARALADLGPAFVLPLSRQPMDVDAAFGRFAPLVIEIGFGMGTATAAIAEARPEVNFLGIEVHPPGVGALLKLIGAGVYSLWKERALLSAADLPMFATGLLFSFLAAWVCVRWLLRYISSHDFTPFAWYRIVFGVVVLATAYGGVVDWSG